MHTMFVAARSMLSSPAYLSPILVPVAVYPRRPEAKELFSMHKSAIFSPRTPIHPIIVIINLSLVVCPPTFRPNHHLLLLLLLHPFWDVFKYCLCSVPRLFIVLAAALAVRTQPPTNHCGGAAAVCNGWSCVLNKSQGHCTNGLPALFHSTPRESLSLPLLSLSHSITLGG